MELHIIVIAILALIVALLIIFRKEAWAYIKRKLFGKFIKKEKTTTKSDKKIDDKKEKKVVYTVEDFIPAKPQDNFERDSSVEELLGFDEYGLGQTKTDFKEEHTPTLTDDDRRRLDKFFSNDNTTFKQINNKTISSKPISKQIKELSPELKALLLDNVLKKRDDV